MIVGTLPLAGDSPFEDRPRLAPFSRVAARRPTRLNRQHARLLRSVGRCVRAVESEGLSRSRSGILTGGAG